MAFPLLGAIASIGSAFIGARAADKAGEAQAAATREAARLQDRQFQTSVGLMQPAIDAGNTARRYQLGALGLPGGEGGPNAFKASPGYEWRLGQGVDAVDQSAAAGGMLHSGATLKALTRYGQDYGSQEFGNWYDRLGGLSGSGDAATGTVVNLGQGNADRMGDLAMRAGDARASSYAGKANAVIGGAQNLANLYSYYNPPAWQLPQAGGAVVPGTRMTW